MGLLSSRRGWVRVSLAALVTCFAIFFFASVLGAQSNSGQQPQQNSSQKPSSDQGIPDAPSAVQPPPASPQLPKEDTQIPLNGPANTPPPQNQSQPAQEPTQPPPPMPPVQTIPPGSHVQTGPSTSVQQQLYKLVISTNFVQVPVTVKDSDGRLVDGLLPRDFSVYEDGKKQQLTFFTSDPFELSVAVVIDIGMADVDVQTVNKTYPALVGAFSPYDEVAVYTFSTTVSQLADFGSPTNRLTASLHQMQTIHGRNNGVPVLSGPLAPNGPIVNNVPVGMPTQPVYTPPRESHVLNDAILRAALDLSKRDKTRRKVIFVISNGQERGSQASYHDVLRVLLANGIQLKAVAVGGSALPIYNKLEKFHIPLQGNANILPRYAAASGGGQVLDELTANSIGVAYAEITSEARNQYTLGYRTRATPSSAYRSIEVRVDRAHLKIFAKDGYYPVPTTAR